jgi:organic hydroperoxide reductase OsmC/OhrA
VAVRAREFRYAVDLVDGGALRTEDGTQLETGPAWSPEHLLLAALVRCTLKSLRHHATRAHIEVAHARGSARALFAKRPADERYAVAECEVHLDVHLRPQPGVDELAALLAKAERDCFIGASLTVPPRYVWITSSRAAPS